MKIRWIALILFLLVAIPLNMYLDGSFFMFGFKVFATLAVCQLLGVFK